MNRKNFIEQTKKIVIKIGTSIITTDSGRIDDGKIASIVTQLSYAAKRGYGVLLVSSGAIATGIEALGMKTMPKAIPDLQASASVGQGLLVHKYAHLFKEHQINVGQVLLTQHVATNRKQYVNAKNTLDKLLELKTIPIINENDSTAVEEIKFGDNDTLAALVANIIEADLLIILSDVDGLYSANPKEKEAHFISRVDEIDKDIEASAGGSGSFFASGGMETKIGAAKMATAGRTGVIIANGHQDKIIEEVLKGEEKGTFFVPSQKKISARKLWILNQPAKGAIVVDKGAGGAILERGKSLLAAGIIEVKDNFEMGDVVDIKTGGSKEKPIARGITNFSSQEIDIISGKKHNEIVKLLNGEACQEVIHRDDMVVLED